MAFAEDKLLVTTGALHGLDFGSANPPGSPEPDGMWLEGTAHGSLAWLFLDRGQDAYGYLKTLRSTQTEHTGGDGKGMVAADRDALTTGFADWVYDARLHVGATAWAIFAEQGRNPFTWELIPNEAPLPEVTSPTLSQRVPTGHSIGLVVGGSDPGGEIVAWHWEVDGPEGCSRARTRGVRTVRTRRRRRRRRGGVLLAFCLRFAWGSAWRLLGVLLAFCLAFACVLLDAVRYKSRRTRDLR